MALEVKQRDGRKWSVTSSGIESLTRRYRVKLDTAHLGANGEVVGFTGLPAIGSAHVNHNALRVVGYEISEGEGASKGIVDVDVKYARQNIDVGGTEEEPISQQVTEWGWDSSTTEREFVKAVDTNHKSVLNSANDPFDSVPMVSVASPVFTKVIKFAERQTGAMAYNCKVNDGALTIGDWACARSTLLCGVAERRIFDDNLWKYEYTITLKYRSNIVQLRPNDAAPTECGWDVAITDAGMRGYDSDGILNIIRMPDPQTGKMCAVTSPALLNGSGYPLENTQSSQPAAINLFFQAYERVSFPEWFYSEPIDEEDDDDE